MLNILSSFSTLFDLLDVAKASMLQNIKEKCFICYLWCMILEDAVKLQAKEFCCLDVFYSVDCKIILELQVCFPDNGLANALDRFASLLQDQLA